MMIHIKVYCRPTLGMGERGGGRRCYDRMVVGFITTYAISAYHH